MPYVGGAPFHGEFSSTDASALSENASRFALYGAGSTSALTLNANDQVIITDLIISNGTAFKVDVYDGADNTVDAGELIAEVYSAVNTPAYPDLTTPFYCQKGTYPKVKAAAGGNVSVQIRGCIIRLGS